MFILFLYEYMVAYVLWSIRYNVEKPNRNLTSHFVVDYSKRIKNYWKSAFN